MGTRPTRCPCSAHSSRDRGRHRSWLPLFMGSLPSHAPRRSPNHLCTRVHKRQLRRPRGPGRHDCCTASRTQQWHPMQRRRRCRQGIITTINLRATRCRRQTDAAPPARWPRHHRHRWQWDVLRCRHISSSSSSSTLVALGARAPAAAVSRAWLHMGPPTMHRPQWTRGRHPEPCRADRSLRRWRRHCGPGLRG